jgi:hypothetical protein
MQPRHCRTGCGTIQQLKYTLESGWHGAKQLHAQSSKHSMCTSLF